MCYGRNGRRRCLTHLSILIQQKLGQELQEPTDAEESIRAMLCKRFGDEIHPFLHITQLEDRDQGQGEGRTNILDGSMALQSQRINGAPHAQDHFNQLCLGLWRTVV